MVPLDAIRRSIFLFAPGRSTSSVVEYDDILDLIAEAHQPSGSSW